MDNIPKGYMKTEIGVIPEGWNLCSLNDISTFRRGSFPQPYGLEKWYDESQGQPFVQVVDVASDMKLNSDTKQHISKLAEKYSVFVPKDSIIVTIQGSIGRVALTQYDSFVDRTLLIFQKYKTQVDPYYFMYAISSLFAKEKKEASGGTIKSITKEKLSGFNIAIPELIEQKNVGTALFDMDALITSFEKLIDKKKMLKQGVMQELLTGKRRLPGFKGEWKNLSLGDFIRVEKGSLITSRTLTKGKIPVIAGGKEPAYYHNEANRPANTITISASGANAGFVNFFDIPIFASDCSTISESPKYNVQFIYFWLKLNQNEIYKRQTGGAQPHIHPSDIEPMEIMLPSSKEQSEIALFISDLGLEIDSLKAKLSKLKQIKQGAMQQLLTGKIRLINK